MARFALIAYLSVTTVIGPALCCCNLGQIVSLASDSNCCGKRLAKADPRPHHHEHGKHGHGKHEHCDHHQRQTPASNNPAGSNEQPTPTHDDHPKNCPCERHYATLIPAPGAENPASEHGSSLFGIAFGFVVLPELAKPDLFSADCQPGANGKPALLFGREMLRAYKTLRC